MANIVVAATGATWEATKSAFPCQYWYWRCVQLHDQQEKAMPANDSDQRFSVEGKSVVISGGTTGIGLATARLLAGCGAKVLIFGRHETELGDALSEIPTAIGLIADQSRIDDIRRIFRVVDQKLGGI